MFEAFWGQLDSQLSHIRERSHAPAKPKRTAEDMLEEIVAAVRAEATDRKLLLASLANIASIGQERAKVRSLADMVAPSFSLSSLNSDTLFQAKLEKAPELKRNLRSEGLDQETK